MKPSILPICNGNTYTLVAFDIVNEKKRCTYQDNGSHMNYQKDGIIRGHILITYLEVCCSAFVSLPHFAHLDF